MLSNALCNNVYCSMESFCLEVNFAVDFNVSFFFRRKSISGVIDFPTRSQREKTENFSILRRCRKVPKWFIGKLIWDTQQLWQIMCGCEAFFIFPIYIATANISGFQFNYNPTQLCICPAMSDQTISFVWNGNWKIYLCNSPFEINPIHDQPTFTCANSLVIHGNYWFSCLNYTTICCHDINLKFHHL